MAASSAFRLLWFMLILSIALGACHPVKPPEPDQASPRLENPTAAALPSQSQEPTPTPYPTRIPQVGSNCPAGGWTLFSVDDGLISDHPRTLAVDDDGRVYVGYIQGDISYLVNGIWTTFAHSPGSPSVEVNKILPLHTADIWAGTQRGYIALYHEDAWKMWSGIIVDGENTAIYDLEVTPDGRVWAATRDGVFQLRGDKWEPFSKPVAENILFSAKSVHLDNEGGLWVGAKYGLHYFKGGMWINIITTFEPIYDVVVIEEDQFGNLWFGYKEGILFFDGASWQRVYPAAVIGESENDLPRVGSLAVGQDGRVWVADRLGAAVYEKGIWQPLIPDVGTEQIRISQVDVDPWGAAWFVSSEGVLCYFP